MGECHSMLQNASFWLQEESFIYDVCGISVFVIRSEQYSDIITVSYSQSRGVQLTMCGRIAA